MQFCWLEPRLLLFNFWIMTHPPLRDGSDLIPWLKVSAAHLGPTSWLLTTGRYYSSFKLIAIQPDFNAEYAKVIAEGR